MDTTSDISLNHRDYYRILDTADQNLISDINQYVEQNQHRFFISRLGQNRLDFNWTLTDQINKLFPFTVSDAGVFKNTPGWVYPVHRDTRRQFAVNLLLSEVDCDFEVNFYSDDLTVKFSIPYNKNQWILINTKKFHEVKNNSTVKDRYVVSIGCENMTYLDLSNSI